MCLQACKYKALLDEKQNVRPSVSSYSICLPTELTRKIIHILLPYLGMSRKVSTVKDNWDDMVYFSNLFLKLLDRARGRSVSGGLIQYIRVLRY